MVPRNSLISPCFSCASRFLLHTLPFTSVLYPPPQTSRRTACLLGFLLMPFHTFSIRYPASIQLAGSFAKFSHPAFISHGWQPPIRHFLYFYVAVSAFSRLPFVWGHSQFCSENWNTRRTRISQHYFRCFTSFSFPSHSSSAHILALVQSYSSGFPSIFYYGGPH